MFASDVLRDAQASTHALTNGRTLHNKTGRMAIHLIWFDLIGCGKKLLQIYYTCCIRLHLIIISFRFVLCFVVFRLLFLSTLALIIVLSSISCMWHTLNEWWWYTHTHTHTLIHSIFVFECSSDVFVCLSNSIPRTHIHTLAHLKWCVNARMHLLSIATI